MLRGVPLSQLAAVHAALGEGFALDEVLAVEQLPLARWQLAEAAWKAKLVSDEPAMEAYREALSACQAAFARVVAPIDDDLGSWVTFLKVYGGHPAPFELLDELGIRMNDLARLSQGWSARMAAEPKLARRATKMVEELDEQIRDGEPIALPRIVVGLVVLAPSPDAGRALDVTPPPEEALRAAAALPVLGLAELAALGAELEAADEDEEGAILARFGLDAQQAHDLDEAWRARLESDDDLRRDYHILKQHYARIVQLKRNAPPLPSVQVEALRDITPLPLKPLPPVAPPRRPLDDTAPMAPVLAHGDFLPFTGELQAVPPIALSLPARPASVDTTADAMPALRDADVLPFARDIDITAVPDGTPRKRVTLPFRGLVTSVGPIVTPRDAAPKRSIDTTADVIPAFRDRDALPFDSSDLDSTALLTSLDLGLDDPPPGATHLHAPILTLEQLASFHAELEVAPQDAAAIRARYQLVDEALQAAEEAAWQARFAANPREARRYEERLAEFSAWLNRG